MRIPQLRCALCVVTLQAVSAVALAAVPSIDFYAPRDYALPSPWSLVIGDFNADSKADLAVANFYHRSVTISINGAGVHFITVGQYPAALALGDFNDDSRPDLAVANSGTWTISVLIGNGDGTFQPPRNSFAGVEPQSLAVADINADQKGDVVVSHLNSTFTGHTISVLFGNGDGTLQAGISVRPEENLLTFSIGDFDNDSRLDIVAGAPGKIAVVLGNGNGTFQPPLYFPGDMGAYVPAVASGDFNGDGNLGAAIGVRGNFSYVFALLGNGDGTFHATTGVRASPSLIAVADFNGIRSSTWRRVTVPASTF